MLTPNPTIASLSLSVLIDVISFESAAYKSVTFASSIGCFESLSTTLIITFPITCTISSISIVFVSFPFTVNLSDSSSPNMPVMSNVFTMYEPPDTSSKLAWPFDVIVTSIGPMLGLSAIASYLYNSTFTWSKGFPSEVTFTITFPLTSSSSASFMTFNESVISIDCIDLYFEESSTLMYNFSQLSGTCIEISPV